MQIIISGRHIDITPAIRDHCHRKLKKTLHHYNLITSIQVTLSVQKMCQKAEARVRGDRLDLFAEAESTDLYLAVDALADKLAHQLHRYTGKSRGHR